MRLRAFLTGASGFIGRRLAGLLLQHGWEVRALVPVSEPSRGQLDPQILRVEGDITDASTMRGAMNDCDALFHLAALVSPWVSDPREFFRVNVGGTETVIEESLRAGVRRFVFTSSLSGIGVRPGAVMREDSPPGKAFGAYEESKADAERVVTRAFKDRGLPAVIVIPSIVIGPGDTRNTGRFLLDFVQGKFPGTFAERSVLPVVGLDDVARGHLLAFERGRVGERYVISAENVTWGELLRIASQVSGVPLPARHIGSRALWLASRTGEALARVTRAPPRMPAWLADFMVAGASMDNAKSILELGMTYAPIRESIRAAVEWFREEGLLSGERATPSAMPSGAIENQPSSLGPFEPEEKQSPPDTADPNRRAPRRGAPP